MIILGIETSCDETAAAVVEGGVLVKSNVIRSSIDLHQQYGGVVPEIAAREHLKIMLPVVKIALEEAKTTWKDIDAIAVTIEPGLIGSLLIGINTARTLALLKNKPLLEVNHIHGHIYSNWLSSTLDNYIHPQFPLLVLTVSGGHNDLILMRAHHQFELIGESIDDAAGEAFDKVAKMLGLPYPGGPSVSKAALTGDKNKYHFPRSWLDKNRFDFSFSGLKTAVLYASQKEQTLTPKIIADLSASFQEAACDVLSAKLMKAAKQYDVEEIHLAGGVSANTRLREMIQERKVNHLGFRYPESMRFCTDNAAMIAAAGYWKFFKQNPSCNC
jgi:N6-L-threonylcarbamoyladenine synthase